MWQVKGKEVAWLDIPDDGAGESLEMGRFFRWKILEQRSLTEETRMGEDLGAGRFRASGEV